MAKATCRSCDGTVSRDAETCPHCSARDPADRYRTLDCKYCKGLGEIPKKFAGTVGPTHSSITMSGSMQRCTECKGSGLVKVPYE